MLFDTEQFNVNFVKAVEEFPALYDTTSKEYSNRDEQEKSWKALAQKFESTDVECKGRWKHLRGSMSRYMKKRSGDPTAKPYYLWNVMQFIIPFMKSRSFPTVSQANPDVEAAQDGNKKQAEEDDLSDDSDPPTPVSMSKSWSAGSSKRRNKHSKFTMHDEFEKTVCEYIASKKEPCKSNADLEFFKSILTDISDFSLSKKRKFKIRVLQLIDELSNEHDGAEHVALHLAN